MSLESFCKTHFGFPCVSCTPYAAPPRLFYRIRAGSRDRKAFNNEALGRNVKLKPRACQSLMPKPTITPKTLYPRTIRTNRRPTYLCPGTLGQFRNPETPIALKRFLTGYRVWGLGFEGPLIEFRVQGSGYTNSQLNRLLPLHFQS